MEAKLWLAEKKVYRDVYSSILKKQGDVIDIVPPETDLGYTSGDEEAVHIAYSHPYIDNLPFDERPVMRTGVFVHELLHRIYTDFSYYTSVLYGIRDENEKGVFALLVNLIEDPSIEYFAPDKVGGEFLNALQFSIGHIYDSSPGLTDGQSPFEQVISALIMFGDSGVIKGSFQTDAASKHFAEIIREFNQMVECPVSKERIDAARRWTVLLRPLWKKDAEDKENFKKELDNLQTKMSGGLRCDESGSSSENMDHDGAGNDTNESSGSGEQIESGGQPSGTDSPVKRQRDNLVKRLTEGGKGEDVNRIIAASLVMDPGEEDPGALSEELVSAIWDGIRNAEATESQLPSPDDIPKPQSESVARPGYGNAPDKNRSFNESVSYRGYEDAYRLAVSGLQKEIGLLKRSLDSVFKEENIIPRRTTSGKYVAKRDLAHTSINVFQKRREPKRRDVAVMLLVDNSGSMRGNNKVETARDTSIVLAEALGALGIPTYIMGFTADHNGYDRYHKHFVEWSSPEQQRAALMQMVALSNNEDGESIRYATRILSRFKAEHKLLFVISDGMPACMRYSSKEKAIRETSVAIRAAQKQAHVLGFGIDFSDPETAKNMYHGSFINVETVENLPGMLFKQLRRLLQT